MDTRILGARVFVHEHPDWQYSGTVIGFAHPEITGDTWPIIERESGRLELAHRTSLVFVQHIW